MKKRPGRCRRCRRTDGEAGRISWGGLCIDCGTAAVLDNNNSLSLKRGAAYEHWRDAINAHYAEAGAAVGKDGRAVNG